MGLILLTNDVYSSLMIEVPISEEINESTLIIKGKIVNKYTKMENIKQYYYKRNGEIAESRIKEFLYTTFVFDIDEVLYGSYQNKTIEVKLQGGCHDNGICESSSWDYDFNKGEKGVIFLKNIYRSNHYMSTAGSYSAFFLTENEFLNRKSNLNNEGKVIINQRYLTIDNSGKTIVKSKLSLEELKSIIKLKQNSK
jgi:hypothetical protein